MVDISVIVHSGTGTVVFFDNNRKKLESLPIGQLSLG
jgi:hypothetical protein